VPSAVTRLRWRALVVALTALLFERSRHSIVAGVAPSLARFVSVSRGSSFSARRDDPGALGVCGS